jgi:hypothetical protein
MSGRYTPPKRPRTIDLTKDLHGHVADFISDTDRAWFDAHPGETTYFRPAIEHETCRPDAAAEGRCESAIGVVPCGATVIVQVRQLAPGARVRSPYLVYGGER